MTDIIEDQTLAIGATIERNDEYLYEGVWRGTDRTGELVVEGQTYRRAA